MFYQGTFTQGFHKSWDAGWFASARWSSYNDSWRSEANETHTIKNVCFEMGNDLMMQKALKGWLHFQTFELHCNLPLRRLRHKRSSKNICTGLLYTSRPPRSRSVDSRFTYICSQLHHPDSFAPLLFQQLQLVTTTNNFLRCTFYGFYSQHCPPREKVTFRLRIQLQRSIEQ